MYINIHIHLVIHSFINLFMYVYMNACMYVLLFMSTLIQINTSLVHTRVFGGRIIVLLFFPSHFPSMKLGEKRKVSPSNYSADFADFRPLTQQDPQIKKGDEGQSLQNVLERREY